MAFVDDDIEAFEAETGISAERLLTQLAPHCKGAVAVSYEADPHSERGFALTVRVQGKLSFARIEALLQQHVLGLMPGAPGAPSVALRTARCGSIRTANGEDRRVFLPSFAGGVSLGSQDGRSGTFACRAWTPGDPTMYLLTCEHVLRGESEDFGHPVVQPGNPYRHTNDEPWVVGTLERCVGVRASGMNRADAAIARVTARSPEAGLHGGTAIPSWRQRRDVEAGASVYTSGAETGVAKGTVLSARVYAAWSFPGVTGKARFGPLITTTSIAVPGDSGSLVLIDGDDSAVGLVAAVGYDTSSKGFITYISPIDAVQDALQVVVADHQWA